VDEGYARFQALLLRVLAEVDPDQPDAGEQIRARLLSEPEARPYQAWISEAEPRMLAVAAQLTARWRE
jgi:hypothetical protein